jgi:hypothetical protein
MKAASSTPDSWTKDKPTTTPSIETSLAEFFLLKNNAAASHTKETGLQSPAYENAGLACRYWGIRFRKFLDMTALSINRSKHTSRTIATTRKYLSLFISLPPVKYFKKLSRRRTPAARPT